MMDSRTAGDLVSSYKNSLQEEIEMPDWFFVLTSDYYYLLYPNCRYKPRIKGRPRKRRKK